MRKVNEATNSTNTIRNENNHWNLFVTLQGIRVAIHYVFTSPVPDRETIFFFNLLDISFPCTVHSKYL